MKRLLLLPLLLFCTAVQAQFGGGFGGDSPAPAATAYDPGSARHLYAVYSAGAGSQSYGVVGLPVNDLVTNDGTWSSGIVLATDIGNYYQYATTASNGSPAGWRGQASQVFFGGLPDWEAKIRTGSVITNVRYGIGPGGATYSADTYTSSRGLWFRYSTSASDPGWMACSTDQTTMTCDSTGVAVSASTIYTLRINCAKWPTSCDFLINGTKVDTKTTNLPQSNGPGAAGQNMVMVATLDNVSKAIQINYLRFTMAR